MRHRLGKRGLGRSSSHRRALLRNQVTDCLRHDRIVTTEVKAKTIRPLVEKMISLGKRGDLHARRQAAAYLTDKAIVKRLFAEVAPRFQGRPGGYTRITKLGPRLGDGARMAQIELVEQSMAPAVLRAAAPAGGTPAADVAEEEN